MKLIDSPEISTYNVKGSFTVRDLASEITGNFSCKILQVPNPAFGFWFTLFFICYFSLDPAYNSQFYKWFVKFKKVSKTELLKKLLNLFMSTYNSKKGVTSSPNEIWIENWLNDCIRGVRKLHYNYFQTNKFWAPVSRRIFKNLQIILYHFSKSLHDLLRCKDLDVLFNK